MGYGDNWLVKPGTVFMFVLMLVFGVGMYTWASSHLEDTGRSSMKEGREAIECSTLDIDIEEFDINETHTRVFFQPNTDVENVYVRFRGGEENVTKVEKSVSAGNIVRSTAPFTDFETVSVKADSCERIFSQ